LAKGGDWRGRSGYDPLSKALPHFAGNNFGSFFARSHYHDAAEDIIEF
jgi:hypothetical protein